jgi:hypothetical protein
MAEAGDTDPTSLARRLNLTIPSPTSCKAFRRRSVFRRSVAPGALPSVFLLASCALSRP